VLGPGLVGGGWRRPCRARWAAPGPHDDKLEAAREEYEDAKLALEQGDLARVPAKSPPESKAFRRGAGGAQALPATPGTATDYEAGSKALATLEKRVAAYPTPRPPRWPG
jgi:hypothetical protein